MNCWFCGIEPDRLVEITRLDSAAREYLPNWPAPTDHQHAEHPPTSAQLEQAGHEALSRVRAQHW